MLFVYLKPILMCLDNKLNEYLTYILLNISFFNCLSVCFEDNFRYFIIIKNNDASILALMFT